MSTVPGMKLPDILDRYLKKQKGPGQGAGDITVGKSYQPISPGVGKTSYKPVKPEGGGVRFWPFVVVLIVVSVLFAVNDFIKDSEPFRVASSFVKENQLIKDDLGEIKEISPWLPSSLKASGSAVRVRMTLRIKGRTGVGKAFVTLVYLGDQWQITEASYENSQGRFRSLIKGALREQPSPAPSGKGGGNLSAGHRFFKQNDFQKAVAAYDQAIATDADNSAAYYWRGRAYDKLNLPDKAAADFTKTVELNPNHTEAYNWLGWLSEKNNKYEACVDYLTKAIALKPDNRWGYYHRGRCYYQQGKKEAALQDADKACKLGYQQACKVVRQLSSGK